MDTRSKIDVLYQDALQDISGVLDRVDALQKSLPAAFEDAVGELHTHAGLFVELTDKLNLAAKQLATQATAIESQVVAGAEASMQIRAQSMVEAVEKLAKHTIHSELTNALAAGISQEMVKLKADVEAASKKMRSAAVDVDRARREMQADTGTNFMKIVATAVAAGLMGAFLALAGGHYLVSTGKVPVQVVVDTQTLAQSLSREIRGK
jgi:hypothetical protein